MKENMKGVAGTIKGGTGKGIQIFHSYNWKEDCNWRN
jgi:hypothetical protein